ADFAWQNGYGAFGVSLTEASAVIQYIANQSEHHRVVSFQEEYRQFMIRHNLPLDERYAWD
ncbi:MAG: transposase, partial [Phycisphaerae bacterium]